MGYKATIVGFHEPEKRFYDLSTTEQAHVDLQFKTAREAIITSQHESGWVDRVVTGTDKTERSDDVKSIIKTDLQNNPDTVPAGRDPVEFTQLGVWTDLGNGGHESNEALSLSGPSEAWEVTGTSTSGQQFTARLCVNHKITSDD